MSGKTARQVAVELLEKIELRQQYANLSLNHELSRSTLSEADQRLVTRLVYGTIQWQLRLDYNWQAFVDKPSQLPLWVQIILRLSLYQFFELDKIPDHAIFNSATEMAKYRDHGRYARLVNAVLRHVQRHGEQDYSVITDDNQRLSIKHSVPLWLVQLLVKQYGYQRCDHLFSTINEPPHISIRVNAEPDNLLAAKQALMEKYPELRESKLSPAGLIADNGNFIETPEFNRGDYTIQDESSMLVAPTMQIASNQRILDACSAPGGKTTHIATYLDASSGGHVVALDIHSHKLDLVEENAQRLHVGNRIKTKLLDAREVFEQFGPDYFDRVLVDAPCSGLGLLRRKPEIRYSKNPEAIKRLPQIQAGILDAAAKVVKKDGLIVYSTCTIIAAENQDVTAQFLTTHPNFEAIDVAAADYFNWPHDRKNLQLLMDDEQADGFFIACFKRMK